MGCENHRRTRFLPPYLRGSGIQVRDRERDGRGVGVRGVSRLVVEIRAIQTSHESRDPHTQIIMVNFPLLAYLKESSVGSSKAL
jgi:hypothetical protein